MADIPPEAYDDRTLKAVKSVAAEIGKVLGAFRDNFVIIGGVVPSLLIDDGSGRVERHAGTMDIDIMLDSKALMEGHYEELVELLIAAGYEQDPKLKKFQLTRIVPGAEGEPAITVIVDFLRPQEIKLEKNKPVLVKDFAVIAATNGTVALENPVDYELKAQMPEGGATTVNIQVVSLPAFLALKGYAIIGRKKEKDCYDIHYTIRNYPGGPKALLAECERIMGDEKVLEGYAAINAEFETAEHYGPKGSKAFATQAQLLGEMSEDQWQQDAFGQIDAWLRAIGIRK